MFEFSSAANENTVYIEIFESETSTHDWIITKDEFDATETHSSKLKIRNW